VSNFFPNSASFLIYRRMGCFTHVFRGSLADVMYGTPWMGGNESVPTGSRDESAELAHAVRRLSAHPSIFAWNGA
jgi:hypothetical protein